MKSNRDPSYLPLFLSKMADASLQSAVMEAFSFYYKKLVSGHTGLIYDKTIKPVTLDEIADFKRLKPYAASGEKALEKAVHIILNGGLGTGMGLTGPKSLLEVKEGRSFLEILVKQAEKQQSKLAIMNSFRTHGPTLSALSKIGPAIAPYLFLQNKFPKVLRKGYGPAEYPENPELEWAPPGHGDIYTALYISGTLQKLLEQNIEYAFVSNSDNLGAALDVSLLGYFAENKLPFMMEVAEKTPVDIKGGHPARLHDGRLILRESSQCPENESDAFRDIHRYNFFNTNNIWINLNSLLSQLKDRSFFPLPMILNPKTVDPNNEDSAPVFQIETAMGAAVSSFENAQAVNVPRSRFFPVKKCNELLAVRSDCFLLTPNERLIINPDRRKKSLPDTVSIHLDPAYYGKINMFEQRFGRGAPSLVDCKSLSIQGNVFFEKNVTIKGTTAIISGKSEKTVKEGSILEGEVIL